MTALAALQEPKIMAVRLILPGLHEALTIEKYEPAPCKPGFVRVAVKATSLNHIDWKRMDYNLFIPSYPHVLGVDIAGIVTDGGESQEWKVGDRIMAPGIVGWSDACSFQSHALVNEKTAAKIPDEVSFEAASTLPFSLTTAACGLYLNLGLSYEPSHSANNISTPVLIWGANGNVGSLAIQLAKFSGYRVIAVTSSEDTLSKVRSLGADVGFSKTEPDLILKIRAAAEQKLKFALDTVVSSESIRDAARCLSAGAVIATAIKYVGPPPISFDGQEPELRTIFSGSASGRTMAGENDEPGARLGRWLAQNLPALLATAKVKPLDFEIIGGLEDINSGLKRMKEGRLGQKLVVQL